MNKYPVWRVSGWKEIPSIVEGFELAVLIDLHDEKEANDYYDAVIPNDDGFVSVRLELDDGENVTLLRYKDTTGELV